ncbi:MAG: septal ring lytic transglycosylase RlpA family protein [Saprospiraceae bacterium]
MKKPFRFVLLFLSSFAFLAAQAQQPEYGQASFYDDSFHGSMTAYNVKYDKNQLSASHKIYPFGTLLRVTRLDNKKSVIVKVIDKGPYIKGRIVDLSKKAALDLDMVNDGVANVKVELYRKVNGTSDLAEAPAERTKPRTTPEEVPAGFDAPPTTTKEPAPTRKVNNDKPAQLAQNTKTPASTATKTTATKTATTVKTTKTAAKPAAKLVKQDYTEYGLYKIQLERPDKKGFGVQVASLNSHDAMMRQIANLQAKAFTNILVSIEKGKNNKPAYKVILGPQETEAAATNYKKSLKNRYKINGFVVDLSTLTY